MKKSKISKSFVWVIIFTLAVYLLAGVATGVYANKLNPSFAGFGPYYNHAILDSLIYPLRVVKALIVGIFTPAVYSSILNGYSSNPTVAFYNSFTFIIFGIVALVYAITAIVIIVKTFTHRKPSYLWNLVFGAIVCAFISYGLAVVHTLLYGTSSTDLTALNINNGALHSYWVNKSNILSHSWKAAEGQSALQPILSGLKKWTMVICLILAIVAFVGLLISALVYLVRTNIYIAEHKYDYLVKRENKAKAKYYKEHGFKNGIEQQGQPQKSKKQLKEEAKAQRANTNNIYANQPIPTVNQPVQPMMGQGTYGPYAYPYPAVMPIQQAPQQPQVIVPPAGGNNVSTGNNAPLIVQYITNGEKNSPVSPVQDPNQAGIYGQRVQESSLTKDDLKSAVLEVLKENNLLDRPQPIQAQQVASAVQPVVQPVVAPVITPAVAPKQEETTIILDNNGRHEEFDVLTVDDLVDLIKTVTGDKAPVEETKKEVETPKNDDVEVVTLDDIQKIISETIETKFIEKESQEAKEKEIAKAAEEACRVNACEESCECEEEIPAPVTVDKTQSEERVLPPIVVAIPSKIEEEAEEEKVESSDEIEITPVENEEVEDDRISEEDLRNLIRNELKEALADIKVETKETIKEVPVYVKPQEPVIKEVIKEVPVVKEVIKEVPAAPKVEEPVVVATPRPQVYRGKENSVEKGEVKNLSFQEKVLSSDAEILIAYNSLKNLLMSYGLKNRVSTSCDTFRLKRKTYCKIAMGGQHIKVYLALDPNEYKNLPVGNAGFNDKFAEIPLVFRVRSDASLAKARELIKDCMAKDNVAPVSEEGKIDYVSELKNSK